jgi:hypothetical protein
MRSFGEYVKSLPRRAPQSWNPHVGILFVSVMWAAPLSFCFILFFAESLPRDLLTLLGVELEAGFQVEGSLYGVTCFVIFGLTLDVIYFPLKYLVFNLKHHMSEMQGHAREDSATGGE